MPVLIGWTTYLFFSKSRPKKNLKDENIPSLLYDADTH